MPRPPENPRLNLPQSLGRSASGAGAAVGRELEGLGRDLQGISDTIDRHLIAASEEKIKADLLDAKGYYVQAEADFTNWTISHQDPNKWSGRLEEHMSAVRGKLSTLGAARSSGGVSP